jgi:hypothetical protein
MEDAVLRGESFLHRPHAIDGSWLGSGGDAEFTLHRTPPPLALHPQSFGVVSIDVVMPMIITSCNSRG